MIERRWSFLVVTSGKPGGQIEAHLVPEDAQGAGPGAVGLGPPVLEDVAEQVKVLAHDGKLTARQGAARGSSARARRSAR